MPVQQTHHLGFDGDTLVKRYGSWSRAEPDREWAGLRLLAEHAPGLAPTPLSRGEAGGAPVVVMSRVPGESLGQAPLTPNQIAALAQALRTIASVPVEAVSRAGLGERVHGPSVFRDFVLSWVSTPCKLDGADDPELVHQALQASRRWLEACTLTALPQHDQCLGLADGNIANVLWDGETCRLVDFEDCGLSDLAYELADVVEHASVRLPRLLDAQTLVEAVGLEPRQHVRWSVCRTLLASFWLVMLLPGSSGFTRNPAGCLEDQARHVLALIEQSATR